VGVCEQEANKKRKAKSQKKKTMKTKKRTKTQTTSKQAPTTERDDSDVDSLDDDHAPKKPKVRRQCSTMQHDAHIVG
jgi:hypothetical protein